jgi:hypothetical protein
MGSSAGSSRAAITGSSRLRRDGWTWLIGAAT